MKKIYFATIIVAFVFSIGHIHAQILCPTPTGLTSTNISATTATLAWNAVSNGVTYNVRYRVSGTTTWTNVTANSTSINLTGLLCGSNYEWQVQTGCSNGTGGITFSNFSQSAFFNTLSCGSTCSVPTGLFVNNVTSTSATLHWNSTGATSYKVRFRVTGTTAWTVKGSSTNSKNLTGLTPATSYQWEVRSRCVDNNGNITYSAWSPISVFQTAGTTTCSTPTGLTSTIGINGVALAWNSTGANSYNIRYRPNNTATWTTTTSNTNSKTLTGLNQSTMYEWQVQGVCMNNGVIILSAWSASAFFTTNSPVSVLPNPASDKIIISHESPAAQNVTISIHDFFGTSYSTIRKSASEGANQYEINISSLKNGIYCAEIAGMEGRQTLKFYVQH